MGSAAPELLRRVAADGTGKALSLDDLVAACPDGDADELVRAAQYHAILPLLSAATEPHLGQSPIADAIHARQLETTAQVIRLEILLARATAALAAAGTSFAVYKGPALAYGFYAQPSHRGYADIDLLVSRADLDHARRALEEAGLRALARPEGQQPADDYGELALHDEHGGEIDLHWHVIREPEVRRAFAIDTEAMLARAEARRIGTAEVPSLQATDMLIAVALHACYDGAYRLGWLTDIARVIGSGTLDRAAFQARCAEFRVGLPMRVMFDRMRLSLGTDVDLNPPAGSGWPAAMRAVSRLRPAERTFGQRGRGGVAFRATRATTASSVGAIARLIVRDGLIPLVRDPDHRWRQSRRLRA